MWQQGNDDAKDKIIVPFKKFWPKNAPSRKTARPKLLPYAKTSERLFEKTSAPQNSRLGKHSASRQTRPYKKKTMQKKRSAKEAFNGEPQRKS